MPAGELGDGGGGSVGGDAFATIFCGIKEISALDEERSILQRPGSGDFQERGVGDRHPGDFAPEPMPGDVNGKCLDGLDPKRSFDLDHLRLLFRRSCDEVTVVAAGDVRGEPPDGSPAALLFSRFRHMLCCGTHCEPDCGNP